MVAELVSGRQSFHVTHSDRHTDADYDKLIMMRTGILYTPDCEWSRVQIDCMLTAIGIR